ncbi:MAG: AAA family ATPase [Brevundimonas sp.]
MRSFEDKPATREAVPLMVGLLGPSGGGKTFSALRLATGIQRVTGGDIFHIDTEARRALHYADKFKFRHLEFSAPFGSLDYLEAIEHCTKKGAKIVIVDSMSHEHEGPGGVLEQHAEETTRLAKLWKTSEYAAQMSAWGPCKANRRTMINRILQLKCNFVFCFRAKEKLKIKKGEDPKPLGYMAIAGEEFVYEMTICALLLPGANGVPTWKSQEAGEAAMIKLPAQFQDVVLKRDGPLDEATGEELARWAAGDESEAVKLMGAIKGCRTQAELDDVKAKLTAAKEGRKVKADELKLLAAAFKEETEALPGRLQRAAEQAKEVAAEQAIEDAVRAETDARIAAARQANPAHDPATGEVKEPGTSATGEPV